MSLAVMKSPARPGATSISAVFFKCDDCGDVSHSLTSLNLHRSVCHSDKSPGVSESEQENPDATAKIEQIAESCECPKCGEHLLLLRQPNFSCSLCEFQDADQERFFVHLKKHYEHSAVSHVDPDSVIIEQVIDDTAPDDRNDYGGDESDVGDDPEYVPSDSDNDDDDDGADDLEESKTKNPKLLMSWKSSPIKGDSKKKIMDFVKPNEDKLNSIKPPAAKSKLGISWHSPQEKGAPKKLSFVKTPVTPSKTAVVDSPISWTPLKENNFQRKYLQTKLNFEKKLAAPSNAVTIKKEPGLSGGGGTRWVRFEDIKCVGGTTPGSPIQRRPRYVSGSSPSKGPNRESWFSGPSAAKRASAMKDLDLIETPKTENEPKKRSPKKKKAKEPKPPPERKIPVCGVCKKIFSSGQALKHHLKIHTGEKNFTCQECGKSFTQWSTCQQHIASLHSGIKKYTCEFCGTSFARSSGLSQHRRIHTGEILHWCSDCGKGFRAKSYLDRHRTLHTGEKRFKCEFCLKHFRTSTDMKRHRNSIHFGLGNVSLTLAKELLAGKVAVQRNPQRPSNNVIQRFVAEDSSSSDESEEIVRATAVIAGSDYEL